MEVVDVNAVFRDRDTVLVRRTVDDTALHAAARQPRRKDLVMVFAAKMIGLLVVGRAAELGGSIDKRLVEHAGHSEIVFMTNGLDNQAVIRCARNYSSAAVTTL